MRDDGIPAAGELAGVALAESAGSHPEYLQPIAKALLLDTWDVHTGLSAIVRDVMRAKSEKDQLDSLHLFGEIKAIWDSGNHKGQRFPPQYFAEWARAKRDAVQLGRVGLQSRNFHEKYILGRR